METRTGKGKDEEIKIINTDGLLYIDGDVHYDWNRKILWKEEEMD